MKTVNINVDWNNEESITNAENAKARLKNKGYKVVNNFGGNNHSVIVMGKKL